MSTSIYTLADLVAVADDLTEDYVLENDIDASASASHDGGDGWIPLGAWGVSSFTGTFDGQGHTISGITISRAAGYQGLFGVVTNSGVGPNTVIQNLILTDVDVSGSAFIGGLIGYATHQNTEVTNCKVYGAVKGTSLCVGLLCGVCSQGVTFTDCFSQGTAQGTSGDDKIGGLIGNCNIGITVTGCGSICDVSLGSSSVGGLIGNLNQSELSYSYAKGTVSGEYYVGGLVGYCLDSDISYCAAYGNVSSASSGNIGGLVGTATTTTSGVNILYCYAKGSVSAAGTWSGGLIGLGEAVNSTLVVGQCYASGAVTGVNKTGGLIGDVTGVNLSVDGCFAANFVSGATGVGGLIAEIDGGAVTDSYFVEADEDNGIGTLETGGVAALRSYEHPVYTDAVQIWNFKTVWKIAGLPTLRELFGDWGDGAFLGISA